MSTRSPKRSCSRCIAGISVRHGGHQVAQKLTHTSWSLGILERPAPSVEVERVERRRHLTDQPTFDATLLRASHRQQHEAEEGQASPILRCR